jgi:hypothetical protein
MISRIYSKELWKVGVSAAVLAAGINVAVFMSARAAGADFLVAGQPTPVSAGHVATASVTTILAATVVAAFARTPRRVRILRFGALGVAVLSLVGPLSMGSGVPTKLALALMHLVVAGTFVCALGRTLTTARASRSESTRAGSAVAPPAES